MNSIHRTADHLIAWNILVGSEDILRKVVAIDMSREEVDRNMVLGTMFDKGVRPCSLCRGRTSHSKLWIHFLDGDGSVVVKLPIACLPGHPGPKIQIGFVPYLEVPLCNFIDAIAIDEVPGKYRHEAVPLTPILRWRHVRFVPKAMQGILSSQLLWHEAQLNKRPHTVGQQAVIDLIHIGEIVNR